MLPTGDKSGTVSQCYVLVYWREVSIKFTRNKRYECVLRFNDVNVTRGGSVSNIHKKPLQNNWNESPLMANLFAICDLGDLPELRLSVGLGLIIPKFLGTVSRVLLRAWHSVLLISVKDSRRNKRGGRLCLWHALMPWSRWWMMSRCTGHGHDDDPRHGHGLALAATGDRLGPLSLSPSRLIA